MFAITFMAAISFSGIYLSFPLFTLPLPPLWCLVPEELSRGKGEEVFKSFWLLFPKSRRPYRDHGVAKRRKRRICGQRQTVFESREENAHPRSPGREDKKLLSGGPRA